MPRERNPNRDKAFELFKKHDGKITNRKIAELLGEKEKTISAWKSRDKWNVVLQKNECSTTKENDTKKRRQGAPKGNKNAKGNKGGKAPPGNKNAVGNSGGAAPKGNKNALTTGEYETIFEDVLTEEERGLFNYVDTSPLVQVDENIRLLSIRERRMLKRISDVIEGMTEKERRVLQERITTKVPVEVHDEATGKSKIVTTKKDELAITELEETEFRKIDDVLKLEEALTRVQDKKLKAIKLKHEIDEQFSYKKSMDEHRLAIEKDKVKAMNKDIDQQKKESEMLTNAIHEVAKRRFAKKSGDSK